MTRTRIGGDPEVPAAPASRARCGGRLALATALLALVAGCGPAARSAPPIEVGIVGDQTGAADIDAAYAVLARGGKRLVGERPALVLQAGDLVDPGDAVSLTGERKPMVLCVLAALLAAVALVATPAAADAPLTLALTPSRDPTALQEAGDEFAKTLAQLSGVPIRAQVASDYAGVVEALRSRRVDLAFVHPVGYVLANREAGCQILVRDVWQGKTAYTARFFVRKGSGVERVEDLRGKTVAFVDPASSSGYIYPMVLLIKKGLVRDRDPKTFFKEALFSGTHEAALSSVLHGRVDAAASFDKSLELNLKDPALIERFAFVGETPEIPEAGICARPGLPAEAVARVKRALLEIKKPEHARVLKLIYDIDGFVEAADRDYDPVRDALDLMNLRPPK
jgi:phosphonate transport system substrate-binding protein